jgi:hypothetical protein
MDWCGIVKSGAFSKDEQNLRKEFERAIKEREWNNVFTILEKRRDLINAVFLDHSSWHSPIHQLALENSPVEIIEKFVNIGVWRTLKTLDGEKAIDIASRKGHHHLVYLLKPVYRHSANLEVLSQIQKQFHQVIIERINVISEWQSFRLPELEVLLEIKEPNMWFPVPGMYGGFHYKLVLKGETIKLISESWSRVVGGSGERHEITSEGWKLTEQGFV